MNPRKPALPWTYEDQQIWRLVGMMNPGGMNFLALYNCWIERDRRDADLMFRAQSNRYAAVPPDFPDAIYAEDPPEL
jgi:hypothetical protein